MTELPAHLPQHLLRLAADGGAEPVWRNELGGTTFRLAPRRPVPVPEVAAAPAG
ncbi:hypothetical protein [Glutamicibacter sp. BSL13]